MEAAWCRFFAGGEFTEGGAQTCDVCRQLYYPPRCNTCAYAKSACVGRALEIGQVLLSITLQEGEELHDEHRRDCKCRRCQPSRWRLRLGMRELDL